MATRILLRPRPIAFGLVCTPIALNHIFIQPRKSFLYCDAAVGAQHSRTPVLQEGKLNPKAIRQLSTGSILGLVGGVAVGTFSKTIAFLIGLGVIGVQWAASYGINLIPYSKIQKYVKGVNVRSLLHDNIAFKLAFGSTFALAAFVDL